MARSTRNRLITHAIPIPKAAHCRDHEPDRLEGAHDQSVGEVLKEVYEKQLDGEINTVEEATKGAERILTSSTRRSSFG